jgi:hypothetical protein
MASLFGGDLSCLMRSNLYPSQKTQGDCNQPYHSLMLRSPDARALRNSVSKNCGLAEFKDR